MTYQDLLYWLQSLRPCQLQMTVTITDSNEFKPLQFVGIISGSDIVDNDHPVLVIK